jgi:hypothetical protein
MTTTYPSFITIQCADDDWDSVSRAVRAIDWYTNDMFGQLPCEIIGGEVGDHMYLVALVDGDGIVYSLDDFAKTGWYIGHSR